MNFTFHVSLTEEDYWEYNAFHMLRSHYGKKQLHSARILFALLFFVTAGAVLIINGPSLVSWIALLLLALLAILLQVFYPKLLQNNLKRTLKLLKKRGKMAYSPAYMLEFFDDCLIATEELSKTAQKYASIERVSIIEGRYIYLHINNLASHILPLRAFESAAQYTAFLAFIQTKCPSVDFYA